MIRAAYLSLAIAVAVVLCARLAGPSDLDTKDQPKTVSYTADAVVNGNWIWPRDMLGNPTYKPPLYNWIDAPLVMALGWDEWVLKLPSIAAGLITLFITMMMVRRMIAPAAARIDERGAESFQSDPPGSRLHTEIAVAIAGLAWIANFATIRLIYVARPDMLASMFVVAGWAAATLLMQQESGRRWPTQLLLWVCVGAAVLTKGPPAMLLLLYIPLAAWLVHGRLSITLWTGFTWGVPLAVAIAAVWVVPALLTAPVGWMQRLQEVESGRIADGGVSEWLASSYRLPAYFVARFVPWSVLFIVALIFTPIRRWFKHPMGPAILWVLLVIAFFSVPVLKRDDYILPAYPAAAIVAAWVVVTWIQPRARWAAAATLVGGIALCAGSAANDLLFKGQTKQRYGDNTRAFAAEVRASVGDDLHRVVFIDTGYNPLQTLLGVNQAGLRPTAEAMAQALWIVRPLEGAIGDPVVKSRMLPSIVDRRKGEEQRWLPGELGLYRVKIGE